MSVSQYRSSWWRLTKMRGMRGVGREVIEHGVDRAGDRFQLGEPRKDRAIANLAVDDEGGALRDLKRVELRRAGAGARFDLGRARSFQQFGFVETAGFRANLRGKFPVVRL